MRNVEHRVVEKLFKVIRIIRNGKIIRILSNIVRSAITRFFISFHKNYDLKTIYDKNLTKISFEANNFSR